MRLTSIEFSFDPCNIYRDGYPADARSVDDSHPSSLVWYVCKTKLTTCLFFNHTLIKSHWLIDWLIDWLAISYYHLLWFLLFLMCYWLRVSVTICINCIFYILCIKDVHVVYCKQYAFIFLFSDTVHSYQAFSSVVRWLQKVDGLRWISTVWSRHVQLRIFRYRRGFYVMYRLLTSAFSALRHCWLPIITHTHANTQFDGNPSRWTWVNRFPVDSPCPYILFNTIPLWRQWRKRSGGTSGKAFRL